MSSSPQESSATKFRVAALGCVLAAIACLYPIGVRLGKYTLKNKIQRTLSKYQITGSWATMEWRGRGLCLDIVRLRALSGEWQLDSPSLCVRLTFGWTWPLVSSDSIWIDEPILWINEREREQKRGELEQKESRDGLHSEITELGDTIQSVVNTMTSRWRAIWQMVDRLEKHELELIGLHMIVNRVPLQPKIDVRLTRDHGIVKIYAFQQDTLKIGTTEYKITPQGVSLKSPLNLLLDRFPVVIEQSSDLHIGQNLLDLSWGMKNIQSSMSVTCSMNLGQIARVNCESKDDQLSRGQFTQLTGSLLRNENNQWQAELKLATPFTFLKKVLEALAIDLPFLQSGDLMLDLKSTSDSQTLEISLQLDQSNWRLPHLPEMRFPLTRFKGEFRSSILEDWSRVLGDLSSGIEWRLEDIELAVGASSSISARAGGRLSGKVEVHGSKISLLGLDADLSLDKVSCQDLAQLVPHALLGPVRAMTLKGVLKPSLQLKYVSPSRAPKESSTSDFVQVKVNELSRRCAFEGMNLELSPSPRVTRKGRRVDLSDVLWLNDPFTFTIDPQYSGSRSVQVGPETKDFVPYEELPSYVGGAMYLTEETGFWRGGALSIPLVTRALNTNLREGRFVYGGSTITQQLVKNIFLHRDKTLTRKFREGLIAARIVDSISKQRVLELYLNMIEFGPNIFGIQSAARYYFQKDARDINPEEAVFLAMLKVSPRRGEKWKKRGRSPSFTWWKQRSIQIFERLVAEGLLTSSRARGAAPFILLWSPEGKYLGSTRISRAEQTE